MRHTKALLLLNMGGPNDLSEVKVFITNMFNDPRILSVPQPIRALIAWLITTRRLKEAQSNYAQLGGKSPIVAHTHNVVHALAQRVDADVFYVMRYTPPWSEEVVAQLAQYTSIYAIPLYPHHSSTTTLSSFDALNDALERHGLLTRTRSIDRYYNHPLWIASLLARIQEALGDEDATQWDLIFSAHGLPKKIIDRGDLYQRHIRYNVYHVRRALTLAHIAFRKTHLAYQSRLGPMEWIRPYLEDTLATLSGRKVLIVPIAFTIDNSETEFELSIEYAHKAHALGIHDYRVAQAPNDHPLFIELLTQLYHEMDQ